MLILLTILMGFAFSIGGEHYFGKWRRGVLVSLVYVGIGLCLSLHWWALLGLGAMFYIYQTLFYDDCIQLIWDGGSGDLGKVLGWAGLFVNGMLCGLQPAVIYYSQELWIKGSIAMVVSGLGFAFICWLSNTLKWHWNGCTKIGQVKVWCPADAWWWASFLMGIILGFVSWCI